MGVSSVSLADLRRVPAVPGLPYIGSLFDMQRDPLGFGLRVAQEFGDVARMKVMGEEGIVLHSPQDIQHVLQTNSRNYSKQTMDYQLLRPLVGNGLLTSDGDFWLRQRRLMQPAFHRQRIAALADMMVEATLAALETWEPAIQRGEAIALDQEMARLTLTIVGRALLSFDLGDEANEFGRAFRQANAHFGFKNFLSLLLPQLPTRSNRQFKQAVRSMDAVVQEIIATRRRQGAAAAPDDLLSLLMEAVDEETGEGMTDQQLRDEVMTILLAGHETTANALTWTFYLLSQHPEEAERLYAEVDQVLAGRPPTFDDLPRLTFARYVFQEALRLYPPAWSIARRSIEADMLGGYAIPGGTIVHINIYVLHHNPRYWEEPERFWPDRFDEAHSEGRHRFAFIPFSAGPRKCIGDQFAMTEGLLILATVVQRLALDLAPGHRVEPHPLITLTPKYGMRMIPRRRTA
ncbi:MAG: cytochrome P450 [Caldilineales bacterium]|nr:cytochrome P450 [Caldilineales bacterium]MDW8317792.1 cytochrome P450 [Anaerolineae bacterium]